MNIKSRKCHASMVQPTLITYLLLIIALQFINTTCNNKDLFESKFQVPHFHWIKIFSLRIVLQTILHVGIQNLLFSLSSFLEKILYLMGSRKTSTHLKSTKNIFLVFSYRINYCMKCPWKFQSYRILQLAYLYYWERWNRSKLKVS